MTKKKGKVFVGLSGGVDSSVSALLLVRQKYEVVGVHLRCWNEDGCDEQEAEDARRVAEKLEIPFYVFDLEEEYRKRVVDYMIDGYKKGITPNPDVMCNKEIKFGLFLEKALELGADYVATGHYVKRAVRRGGFVSLLKPRDSNKDQSYFLWALTQDQLRRSIFPLGGYKKSEVRKLAKQSGLPTAEKKDSQGICFVGKVSLEEFLEKRLPPKEGEAVTPDGTVVGTHRGAHLYTIGQRRGLGNLVHGRGSTDSQPFYVIDKDIKRNVITVVEGDDDKALYVSDVTLRDVNFLRLVRIPAQGLSVRARVRYRQPLSKAMLYKNGDEFKISFSQPQKFVAAGQSAVFYSKLGELLGGGVIQ